jgi:hypothetical protein
VEFVAPSPELAVRAGSLCFVLATATEGQTIVTSDRALARTARAEGIEVELVA